MKGSFLAGSRGKSGFGPLKYELKSEWVGIGRTGYGAARGLVLKLDLLSGMGRNGTKQPRGRSGLVL